jgi:hypothetical protein
LAIDGISGIGFACAAGVAVVCTVNSVSAITSPTSAWIDLASVESAYSLSLDQKVGEEQIRNLQLRVVLRQRSPQFRFQPVLAIERE